MKVILKHKEGFLFHKKQLKRCDFAEKHMEGFYLTGKVVSIKLVTKPGQKPQQLIYQIFRLKSQNIVAH